MDSIRIPPTDLTSLLAERIERMEKFREDRDRPLPSKREPKRRRPSDEEPDEDSGQRGKTIAVDA